MQRKKIKAVYLILIIVTVIYSINSQIETPNSDKELLQKKRNGNDFIELIDTNADSYISIPLVQEIPVVPPVENIAVKTKVTNEGSYLELKQFSEHYHYGNGSIGFSSRLGDQNVWDGEQYQYYIWNDIEKSVQFANSKLFFYDWYCSFERNNTVLIDDMRWIVQRWSSTAGGRWLELDLYDHNWFEPIVSSKSIEFIQSYNDGSNYLNVSYLVSNQASVKVSINFHSGGDYQLRFNWQLSGISGVFDSNMSNRIFSFDDVVISCNDTESDVGFTYDWIVETKKLDIYLGNYNVTINEEIYIDPTFSEKASVDANDFVIKYDAGYTFYGSLSTIYIGLTSGSAIYRGWEAWETGITDSLSSVTNAEISLYIETNNLEAGDYIGLAMYGKGDVDDLWDETEADADEAGCWTQENYYLDNSWCDFGGLSGNTSFDDSYMGVFMDEWLTYHNIDPSNHDAVSFNFVNGTSLEAGDYIVVSESTTGTAANRPTLEFTYTLAVGNNAPNAPTLDTDSGNTFAGKWFNVKTDHTDDDGETDIETMYLQHYYSGYNVTMSCPQDTTSGSVTVIVGSSYIIGTPTYSHTTEPTNGHRVTWNITFDWDFVDDTAYIIYGRTVDDEPEWSAWTSLDTNNLFENDIEVETLLIAIDGNAEYGGSNAQIDDDDWFRGGVEITCSGTVEYQGTSQTFDSLYSAGVDIELYYDSGATGEKDLIISSGAFSAIIYTPTSASGLDTTAYFDVVINDIPTGGSDVTDGSIEITSKRDNEDPTTTFNSLTEGSPNTYIYATSQTLYFSDEMGGTDQLFTIAVTASDSSGSGIYAVEMSSWDDDAEWNDTSSPYSREYSVDSSETSGSITLYAIDNVGNIDDSSVVITMTEDLVSPSSGTFIIDSDNPSIGYAPNTNYDDDSTINFTASGWIDGSSGLPTNCYSYNESAWTSSTTVSYGGQNDGNITVTVYIRDNVGNNATASDWVIIDTDSPSDFTLTWSRVNDTYPCVKNSTGFYFDDTQNNYTTIVINDDGTIENSEFWFVVWDNNSVLETSIEDNSGLPDEKNFNYYSDDNGTFVILVVNNAGNYQNISVLCYDTYDSGEEPETTTTTIPITKEGSPDIEFEWDPSGIFSGFGLWLMNQGWILIVGCVFLFFLWKAISQE